MYLDRVGCTDCLCCHLEEIWLFVTGLSHPNGNVGHLVEIVAINEGDLVMRGNFVAS